MVLQSLKVEYENGSREEMVYNSDDFHDLGLAFERSIDYKPTEVGLAESRLLPMMELIDFAIDWFQKNR